MKHVLARLGLVAAAILVALILVEFGLRATRLDGQAMIRVLYYQGVLLNFHEAVEDPDLLFRLQPNTRDVITPHTGRPCAFEVDKSGARGPQRPTIKPPGTTRVLFFGGSTVFGAGVCDDETITAHLERALDRLRPGKHEVWNFGTSAYTGSQVIHRASLELAQVQDSDLLVLLPTNVGRRPFLDGPEEQKLDFYRHFRTDPTLWLENFYVTQPWPGLSLRTTNQLHWGWLRWSALYRYTTLRTAPAERTNMVWNPYVASRANDKATQLAVDAAERGVPVVYVLYPQPGSDEPGYQQRTYPFGEPWITLDRPGLEPEDRDLHPASERLDAHAQHLATLLIEGGFLEP